MMVIIKYIACKGSELDLNNHIIHNCHGGAEVD